MLRGAGRAVLIAASSAARSSYRSGSSYFTTQSKDSIVSVTLAVDIGMTEGADVSILAVCLEEGEGQYH
jgi:hypothetical protein